MRHWHATLFGTVIGMGIAAAIPAVARSPKDDADPWRYFDTRKVAAFANPRPGLVTYLGRKAAAGTQHFCVLGQAFRASDGRVDRQVWVHWREGRRLILWDGSDPRYPASRIGWGRRDLDLDRDVVADDAGVGVRVGSSTYLVTRAWPNRIIADCATHGRRLRIVLRRS